MKQTTCAGLLALVAGMLILSAGVAPANAAEPGIEFFPRDDGYPFSAAVQVGDVLYLSWQIGAAEDGRSVVPGGMPAETRRMMELIGQTLNERGLTFEDVFKCTVMLADMSEWPAFNEIYASYFKAGRYPARSAMGVNGLALGARVELECMAHAPVSHPASVDAEAQAQEIVELEAEWSRMFGAGDLDGIAALLAQDSVLIMPGSPPVVGAEAIRTATRAMLESGDQVSWKSDRAYVAPSGDMAYDYGTATTRLADGSVVEGYYLVVWTRENGEWKVAADMFN